MISVIHTIQSLLQSISVIISGQGQKLVHASHPPRERKIDVSGQEGIHIGQSDLIVLIVLKDFFGQVLLFILHKVFIGHI